MRHNGEVPQIPQTEPEAGVPSRLRNAVFQAVADEGKAALVERRLSVAINRGVLQAGERLPPESELAKSLGVSPVTVREALVLLRQRGLVTTKRGRGGGSFVTAGADPASHAADELASISRTALRDLAAHYFAVTAGCLELAASRAAPNEVDAIRSRLTAFGGHLAQGPDGKGVSPRRLSGATSQTTWSSSCALSGSRCGSPRSRCGCNRRSRRCSGFLLWTTRSARCSEARY